ncbi:hypothetical protein OQA88_949 [Cercophora sp. LCS_1]
MDQGQPQEPVAASSTTSDNESIPDSDSEASERCWWCRGGITLPRYTNKTDKPCAICKECNLLEFLLKHADRYDSAREGDQIELGWVDEVALRRRCPLCRIAVHSLRQKFLGRLPDDFWENGMVGDKRTKVILQSHLPPDHEWKGTMTQGSLLVLTEPPLEDAVPATSDASRSPDTTVLARPEAVLLSEGCLEPYHAYGGVKRRRLWPDVSLGLLGEWLKVCEKVHPSRWKPRISKTIPKTLRVIDLDKACLVDMELKPRPTIESLFSASPVLELPFRYVTLSYVWGGPQAFVLSKVTKRALYQPGSLSPDRKDIPWTIRDFFRVVLGIGERYAWVDSLCIAQDDPAEVRQMVSAMDLVYENAFVTVAAASGTSAADALPGIRPGTRQPLQGREVFQRMALGVPLPPLDEVITASTWDSRGWTYQESVLSPRTLYFTDGQVHYKCARGCTACEETWEDSFNNRTNGDSSSLVSRRMDNAKSILHSYEPKKLSKVAAEDAYHGLYDNFGWWTHHVREMCRRNTTVPKDRLHALDGVLHHLQDLFDGHEFVWGLPSSALEVALLWRPVQNDSSRGCFRNAAKDNTGVVLPSWSWAGWTGEVYWRLWNICETAHSAISWIDMTKAGPAEDRRFDVRTCRAPTKAWLDENGFQRRKELGATGFYYVKDGREGIRYAHPVAFAPDEGPLRALDRETGELNFFAKTAEFRIPREHLEERAAIADSELDGSSNNIRHLCLFDADGHVAGVALADPDTLKALNQASFECIAIVNTTLCRVEWDYWFDEEEDRFKHITEFPVIEKKPGEKVVHTVLPTAGKEEEWDFYDGCWHGCWQDTDDISTCPFFDTRKIPAESKPWCVSPFRSIHPNAGPFPFDPRHYSIWRPWPLFEVLLVRREGEVVSRIGVGYVNWEAFTAVATEKHIRLR